MSHSVSIFKDFLKAPYPKITEASLRCVFGEEEDCSITCMGITIARFHALGTVSHVLLTERQINSILDAGYTFTEHGVDSLYMLDVFLNGRLVAQYSHEWVEG